MRHLTLFLLATLAFAPEAHAIHAYHSDWCFVAEGVHGLPFQLRSNYDWIEATPRMHTPGDSSSIDGAIVDAAKPLAQGENFLAQETKITNQKTVQENDGCWSGTTGGYDAVMLILEVSPKASALGLKPGLEIPVHCTPEDLDPDGLSC